MGRKVRRQVTLDAEQDAALRQKARELGISDAEVIRRGIALVCGAPGKAKDQSEPEHGLRGWKAVESYVERKRTDPTVPQTGRGWTREELYDERMDRYSH